MTTKENKAIEASLLLHKDNKEKLNIIKDIKVCNPVPHLHEACCDIVLSDTSNMSESPSFEAMAMTQSKK